LGVKAELAILFSFNSYCIITITAGFGIITTLILYYVMLCFMLRYVTLYYIILYYIILYYYNTYHCVTIAYSIQYSNMLYSFVA